MANFNKLSDQFVQTQGQALSAAFGGQQIPEVEDAEHKSMSAAMLNRNAKKKKKKKKKSSGY